MGTGSAGAAGAAGGSATGAGGWGQRSGGAARTSARASAKSRWPPASPGGLPWAQLQGHWARTLGSAPEASLAEGGQGVTAAATTTPARSVASRRRRERIARPTLARAGWLDSACSAADPAAVELRDRVVVVTGASSGIGRATAVAFARRGARVVAVARRETLLRELLEELRGASPHSEWLAGDLGERAFAQGVVRETLERHGRIDVLVNNAAMTKHKQIHDVTPDEVERVLAVNTLHPIWTTLAALPAMLRQGSGCIVNVSSVAGELPPPREAIYAASKAALSAFTEGLWNDLEGTGIHAALVVPGAIDTEIWEKLEAPSGYRGAKAPPQLVADAIVRAVLKRRHRVTVPRSFGVGIARVLKLCAPGVLRLGMRRMDPVPAEVVERARRRAVGS